MSGKKIEILNKLNLEFKEIPSKSQTEFLYY